MQAAEHSQWPMKTPLASSHARTGKKLAGSSHPQLPPQTAQTWEPLTFHTAQRTLFTSWCFNSLAHLILNVAPPTPQPGSPGGHQDLQSISTNRPLGLGIQVQRVWVEQADLPPHTVVVSLKTDALSSSLPPGSPAAAHHSPRNGSSIYQHPHTETHPQ